MVIDDVLIQVLWGLDITPCANSVNSAESHTVLTRYVLATRYATVVAIPYSTNINLCYNFTVFFLKKEGGDGVRRKNHRKP